MCLLLQCRPSVPIPGRGFEYRRGDADAPRYGNGQGQLFHCQSTGLAGEIYASDDYTGRKYWSGGNGDSGGGSSAAPFSYTPQFGGVAAKGGCLRLNPGRARGGRAVGHGEYSSAGAGAAHRPMLCTERYAEWCR
jgi:hypothetical protein